MKPTITKEQAEAIELWIEVYERQGLERGNSINAKMLIHHAKVCDGETSPWFGRFVCLNDLDIMTLAAALVNGYEVEATPEDRVREYYAELQEKERTSQSRGVSFGLECERDGAINTLNLLGIKIEGVNAR
ncbi:hypothetical protein P9E09_06925 [Bacillus mojavensis]|uniref:hypothetical protein n=1 Tax=Bacillus mojavensis TaxID=72360 RepID=UPI002DB5B771|nr:hypothetical protein [Bacillus mojavensis]MEC1707385.1 hypothetical protein [Bacillus mojavensis]